MSAAIGVIGAGAWGTALAQAMASNGSEVLIWAREAELVEEINRSHTNSLFLPGAALAPTIRATGDMADLAALPILLVVTPAQHLARVLKDLPDAPRDLVLCSKGIEAGTGRLMAQVAEEAAPGAQIAVLSGPTFAHEVAAGLPTAVTLACGGGEAQWQRLSAALSRPMLRPYYSDDVTGAEIGGSVKNVLAIATGLCDGLDLGLNARAALVTRGLAEMTRLGLALGARADTFMGLSGLGDLVLTATGDLSRNRRVGQLLAQGLSLQQAIDSLGHVAEGVYSARTVVQRALALGVDMPIAQAVVDLLDGRTQPAQAVAALMGREPTAERT